MIDRNTEQAGQVLKTDKVGRVRSTPAQREAVLAEFERSGLTGTKFAALAGVNYQTFAGWMAKRRRTRNSAPESVVEGTGAALGTKRPGRLQWVEAVMAPSQRSAALVVELRGGMRLEISAPGQVSLAAELLKALEPKEGWPC